jgi:hypothetical protein
MSTQITTHFVTAEIDLQETIAALHEAIEANLQNWGEPLRWAVVAVDLEQQKAHVEAVVMVNRTGPTT